MAVVIRLQGLPIVAGTMDIRHFFSGLTIPDGGVHIVGGEHGEAFIVFATDEDARLGMMRTGGAIKGSKVSLLLSSKTEMQNMIEHSRRRFETGNVKGAAGNGSRPGPTISSGGRGSLPTTLQVFSNTTPTAVTTAASAHETISNKNVSTFATTSMGNMPPSFSNNFSSPNLTMGSTMTTAMSSLNSIPPPIPPLPTMPSLPPMPSIPPMPLPPPVSSMPPLPTVSPLTQGPPVLPMSHLSHMGSMPPFNPGIPPPGGLVSGLPLGTPNHMFLGHMNPLLNLQAHMKAAIGNPDELYVHLQGLPFSGTEMDIREFFRGLAVDSIRLVRDNMGRSSGRALAKFFSPQDTFEALKRSTGMLGQRYVDISPATESQWMSVSSGGNGVGGQAHSKSSNVPQDQHRRSNMSSVSPSTRDHARSRSPHNKEFCVYLKGLPYEAVNKQICEFFKNLNIMEDCIYIAYGPSGRATGQGFVQLKDEMDYKVALSCHMQYMGSRFIQVHPISKKAMFEKIDSIRQRMQGVDKKNNSESGKNPRNCAHISNIPYNVSKKDVHLFLKGIAVFEESLKVLVDSSGNGLGQAVVQFRGEEDALNAERLHRQKLNGRDAFVDLVTFEQMKVIERNPPPQVRRVKKLEGNSQGQAHGHAQAQNPIQAQAHPFAGITGEEFNFLRNTVGNLGNGPFAQFTVPGNGLVGPPPLPPFAASLENVALSIPPPMVAGHLPGAVLAPPSFRPGSNNGPPGFGPEGLRGRPPFDNGSRKSGGHNNRGSGQGRSEVRPQSALGRGPGSDPLREQSTGGPGNPRGPTIVKIQNMPFAVTVDEILDLFYGYQVLPGSVCQQLSEKGLPTGEAMVAFESHEEASSAVMDLNDRPIGARKVKITLG
ncbi:RNA-binding protein 12 [Salvelinus sp. IW2-2015]|uniref:RNA-binding protein 12 n=1 Tax=Salvelinus sp. IW2-2015 TaxID=2691554 RepID=UPI000CDFF0D1|nr:RNA-binding protein 12 [Salvelinus alpinus]XP_023851546.1 RNA-binding protein 12 [Salvelinus alpinus]XP_023851547.1 RNA-binding protein 12 [Salvelinus alpinus]XP_023851548.1 RNA-binding protein 12 [Salvelinus alpinus]